MNLTFTSYLILAITVLFSSIESVSCSPPLEVQRKSVPDTTQTLKEFLNKYEKTFDPSAYEIPITIAQPKADTLSQYLVADSVSTDSLQYTSGFRVQILTTQDIDQANRLKDSLNALLPTEWTYIIYHVPYYKVRVGNYYERSSANRTLRHLLETGFQDSWIVPDKIIKNPPFKLPPVRMPIDTLREE
ncbi:MAG: SPOR domain-containing protein [Bacteroidetes bacterium]|nr:MAG: SPOR domain-containing protein [Bacteroidota bacterium]